MQGFSELALVHVAEQVAEAHPPTPDVAVVAGSGFGGLAALLENPVTIPYDRLHGVPSGHVLGHAGRLLIGALGDTVVALFDGRAHMYQGHSALDAAFTARLAAPLGASAIVLTNAAGGVNPGYAVGDLMLIEDHINLTARSPLQGWSPEGGVPFVPMDDAWDPALRTLALHVGSEQGLELHSGVYAQLLGPQFETPAEVAMVRSLGADVVGMSTVMEAIAARALGLRVLGISLVTNAAGATGLSHEEVLETGRRSAKAAGDLLVGILQGL